MHDVCLVKARDFSAEHGWGSSRSYAGSKLSVGLCFVRHFVGLDAGELQSGERNGPRIIPTQSAGNRIMESLGGQ